MAACRGDFRREISAGSVKHRPRGCVAADVGQHHPPPAAFVSGGVISDRSAPTGQAAAGSVITWHRERAGVTRGGMKLVGPDAAGTRRPLAPRIEIKLELQLVRIK